MSRAAPVQDFCSAASSASDPMPLPPLLAPVASQPITLPPPAAAAAASHGWWLERLTRQRRGSNGFYDDKTIGRDQDTPSPPDKDETFLRIPKLRMSMNIVAASGSPNTTQRNNVNYATKLDDNMFDFRAQSVDENADNMNNMVNLNTIVDSQGRNKKTVLKNEVLLDPGQSAYSSARPQLAIGDQKGGESLVEIVKQSDFPIMKASQKELAITKKKEETRDVLDNLNIFEDESMDEMEKEKKSNSKKNSREEEKEIKPGKITSALMNTKWAQNWFFNNGSANNEVDSKTNKNETKQQRVNPRREKRELNFFSPQNL